MQIKISQQEITDKQAHKISVLLYLRNPTFPSDLGNPTDVPQTSVVNALFSHLDQNFNEDKTGTAKSKKITY